MAKNYHHQEELSSKERKLREQEEIEEEYNRGVLFKPLDSVKSAQVPEALWGNWIVRDTILLQSGVGGVSKTTFNFSMLLNLQRNGEYLDIPGVAGLKVLYFDFEGSDSITKARLNLIGELEREHPFFYVCNKLVPLTSLEKYVERFMNEYWKPDIFVFDPFSLALEMENENDNVEATNKMKYMRDCMRKWNASFIITDHSSKADVWGVGNARGAGAKGNLADIVWSYHPVPLQFGHDMFVLEISKNRELSDGFCQCIQKQEGDFVPVEEPEGFDKTTHKTAGIATFIMGQRIEVVMKSQENPTKPLHTQEIIKLIEENFNIEIKKDSPDERCFFRAITPLLQKNIIYRYSRGIYCYMPESQRIG